MKTKTVEPAILTAKTYFWYPGGTASQRRRNEKHRLHEVECFLGELGFDVFMGESGHIIGEKHDITVDFSYSESSKHVYKRLSIYKNGKLSNITTLRKMY